MRRRKGLRHLRPWYDRVPLPVQIAAIFVVAVLLSLVVLPAIVDAWGFPSDPLYLMDGYEYGEEGSR